MSLFLTDSKKAKYFMGVSRLASYKIGCAIRIYAGQIITHFSSEVRMPPSSSEWEGKGEVERKCHKVEVGHLLEPGGSLLHHQLVTPAVSCHHADLVGADLQT